MFSLKSSLRKTITVTMASVMITTVFVGCSGNTDSYATGLDVNVSTTTSITTTVADNITNPTPGATDANSDFSVKYKYWYDSDYTKESQPITDTTAIESINTDKQLFGLEDLPIHTDENGNEFIMSGRRQVYLENGKLPLAELVLLRTEGESDAGGGQRVYTVEDPASTTKELEAFDSMLEANGIEPPTSIEERQTADSLADEKTVSEGLTIFVNNLETGYKTDDDMINISAIYAANNALGTVMVPNDSQAQVVMNTAAGQVTVSFGVDESTVSVSYSMEMDKTTLENTDITLADNTMQLTPDALERTLGYDVEVYADAGFINIVTDNRDLFTAETLVDTEDIPQYVNVGQVIVVEDEKPEPSKPETQTTPDGKYDLAATDLQNPDGTYTQDLGSCDTVSAPTFLAEVNDAWSGNNDRFDSGSYNGKQSNPSQIPYSQITLENAHEAFPYMGFTGQHPGYIEILPSDSPYMIAMKVWNNLVGNDSLAPGRNYEGHGYGYMPEHVFSSEADYNAWVADQKAQRAAADAAAAAAQERIDSGDYGFSGTKEDIENILAGW